MKLFFCSCETQSNLFFESQVCTVCGRLCGYINELSAVVAFSPKQDAAQEPPHFVCQEDPQAFYTKCANYRDYDVCNGMVRHLPSTPLDANALCFACTLNEVVPDATVPEHLPLWKKMETAKRRTIYTLQALNLAVQSKADAPDTGIHFRFLSDKTPHDHFQSPIEDETPVYTGHHDGVVTINLAEADDVARHRAKHAMGESYRTLLGHFRHEIGHYYWDLLISNNQPLLKKFRQKFGDEREDYQKALKRHYDFGAPVDWQNNFVSSYASMHPWEDWAETWAHYLHMIDTLETAQAAGLHVEESMRPAESTAVTALNLPQAVLVYDRETPIKKIISTWMRLSVILNSLNRSMGLADPYPFVLNNSVQEKLIFVHDVLSESRV